MCGPIICVKYACGQKPTFIFHFYIYYIYFITLQKKKNWETDQKPLQMAQPCGFAGFSKLTKNWPFAHFFWPFYHFFSIQKYKKYSLDRNFWPLPTFSDQKLTTKMQKEIVLVRPIKLNIRQKNNRRCIPRYWIALFIPYRIKSITHIWRSNPPNLSAYFIIRITLFIPYRIKSITHIWRSNPP